MGSVPGLGLWATPQTAIPVRQDPCVGTGIGERHGGQVDIGVDEGLHRAAVQGLHDTGIDLHIAMAGLVPDVFEMGRELVDHVRAHDHLAGLPSRQVVVGVHLPDLVAGAHDEHAVRVAVVDTHPP